MHLDEREPESHTKGINRNRNASVIINWLSHRNTKPNNSRNNAMRFTCTQGATMQVAKSAPGANMSRCAAPSAPKPAGVGEEVEGDWEAKPTPIDWAIAAADDAEHTMRRTCDRTAADAEGPRRPMVLLEDFNDSAVVDSAPSVSLESAWCGRPTTPTSRHESGRRARRVGTVCCVLGGLAA